jgi:hypothetical protein
MATTHDHGVMCVRGGPNQPLHRDPVVYCAYHGVILIPYFSQLFIKCYAKSEKWHGVSGKHFLYNFCGKIYYLLQRRGKN